MSHLLHHNIYANSGTQELKPKGLRVAKTLIYDFKVAIKFLYAVSLRQPKCNMTRMLYNNLYANSDTQELKLQWLSLPKPYFTTLRRP